MNELKAIARDLGVEPTGDRRKRQTWEKAIEQHQLFPVPQSSDTSVAFPGVDRVQGLIESPPEALECPECGAIHALFTTEDCLEKSVIRCLHCLYSRIKDYPGAIQVQRQEPERKNISGVDRVQESIAQAANFVPGVEVDRSPVLSEGLLFLIGSWLVVSLPRLRSFTLDEPPDPHDFESLDVFHEAIALWDSQHPDISLDSFTYWAPCPDDWYEPAGENSPGVEVDHFPVLSGFTFSDRFLARYFPPQAEVIHFQSDADGQLSLLDFEVESVDEPPDPDDFESLDAFRQAIALWDSQHPDTAVPAVMRYNQ